MGEIRKEKLKRGGFFALAAALVYLGFRFVLPVAAPFVIGWFLAVRMKRLTVWLKKRLKIPEGVSAAILLALEAGAAGAALYFLGGKLIGQLGSLAEHFPGIAGEAEELVFSCCRQAEDALSLPQGVLVGAAEQARTFVNIQIEEKLMPAVAELSVPAVKWTAKILTVFTVSMIACILSVTEMDELKKRQQKSTFGTEATALCRRLAVAGGAYLKSQMVILLAVTGICIAGLWLLGNPYPVAAGIGLGFVDLLPVLGTGTVLLPWALFCLFQKQYLTAAGLAVIYGICYFFREFAEARMMGSEMGITGLETLISIYVGISLFGLWGMLLGPAGYLMIREILTMY